MADAVIVVDMLRCFMEPGHPLYAGDKARRFALEHMEKVLGAKLTSVGG